VIAGGDSPVVTFADGTTEQATIVAGDPSRDLAVLKVDRTDLVPLAVGDSDELRLGDQLIAIGYALDLNGEPSVTAGILSATNRTITEQNGTQLVNLLQTDTAINPGNSGGPLLNGRGEVVGINTAIAGRAQNIGFAIAITPVMDIIDELRGGNVPGRALLGVSMQPTGVGPGAVIVEVTPGSGAADGGLRGRRRDRRRRRCGDHRSDVARRRDRGLPAGRDDHGDRRARRLDTGVHHHPRHPPHLSSTSCPSGPDPKRPPVLPDPTPKDLRSFRTRPERTGSASR
jgi:S1-C subfamily serine protease